MMNKKSIKLTLIFENPFWVGIFEREIDGEYSVARTVFGGEPKDYEVYDFLLHAMDEVRFSRPGETEVVQKKVNYKRLKREVKKELEKAGNVNKAQDAMRVEQEKNKKEKKSFNSKRKEEMKQEQFALKQAKRKEKKRGH